MSSITLEHLENTENKTKFKFYLHLVNGSSPYEWTSEVFHIFCKSIAIELRCTRRGNNYIKIFIQLKASNGVRRICSLSEVQNASKRVDILETDLYTWQLIAQCQNYSWVYITLCLNDKIPFKKLYENADLTDFELYAKNDDGQESVPVHRCVLAVSSPVLKSMLLGDWKEAKQGYVQLPAVTKTTLQHLKDCIYLNQYPDEPLDYAKLITLASYYMLFNLPKLEQWGTIEIPKKFNPENFWEWFDYCVQHHDTKLLLLRLKHSARDDVIAELERYFSFKNDNDIKVPLQEYNDNFKELYDDTDFTDFELGIEGEDGICFHKYVLAAFSPVMRTLLLGDWREAKQGNVQLPNISKATIQHFKEFIYLKKLPEDPMECVKLFPIASHYKMPELERDAAIKISQNFNPENAWEWIEYCTQNKAARLLVAILKNIADEDKIDTLEEYLLKK